MKPGREGMIYVALLVLVLVLSVLGFAFVCRTETARSSLAADGNETRARYLADSAANHAMWRVLNQSDFPEGKDERCTHMIGSGRYAYRVVRGAAGAPAVIHAEGAAGDSVVRQSYAFHMLPEGARLRAIGQPDNGSIQAPAGQPRP